MNDRASTDLTSAALGDRSEGDLLPLSTAQQAVLLDQLLHPELPCYNVGGVARFEGAVRVDLLEAAIAEVAQRHDAMRLVLLRDEQGGLATQRVLPHTSFVLPRHDYSTHADGERRAWQHIEQAYARPFEMWEAPLWELQWVQATPTQGLCLMRFHHLVADGVSISVIGGDIVQAYNRRVRGLLACDAEPVARSYTEHIRQEQVYLSSARFEQDRQYWFDRLAGGVQPLLGQPHEMPGHRPTQLQIWEIQREEYEALQAAAQAMGGSITQLLLAVIGIYFARVAGARHEALLGLAVHGRSSSQWAHSVGFYSKVLPISVPVHPGMSVLACVQEVSTRLRVGFWRQRYPLDQLAREVRTQGQRQRLWDITVSIEPFDGDVELEGGRVRMQRLHNGYEPGPLALAVCDYEKTRSVQVQFKHDPQVLDANQAQATIRRLRHLLRAAAAQPEALIERLPLLPEAELQVLQSFNRTQQPYPGGRMKGWPSRCHAAWSWWWRCWPRSRRAGPTCHWTLRTRRSACATCCKTASPWCC
jgi:hypothetical protein